MKSTDRLNLLITLLVFVVLVWVYFALPPLGIYADDGGCKYIQMESFSLNKWSKLDIEYPGKEIGLDNSFLNPVRKFKEINGKLFCTYPPVFAFLSSLLYPALGDRVIHFFPLLSFFLSFLIFAKTLRIVMKVNLYYYLLIISFLAASPLFLYSIIFWEHASAILFVVLSLYYLVIYFEKKISGFNIFCSSFLLGLSIFFRTEMLFFILAYFISLSWVLWRRKESTNIASLLWGLLLPVSGYILFNLYFYDNFLGLHLVSHPPIGGFSRRRTAVYIFCFFFSSCLLFFLNKGKNREGLRSFNTLVIFIWLGLILVYFKKSPVPALFLGFPLLFFIFFAGGEILEKFFSKTPDFKAFLFALIISYISLVAVFLLNNPDTSQRYLLAVVPLGLLFLGISSPEITKSIILPINWTQNKAFLRCTCYLELY